MADFWRIPFHTEITSVYAGLRNKLSTPPKRSVSAEVCECTHKFRITNTSVEILKKEIVVFEPIFTFEKECFTIIFLLISADGRFLKNSLSTPKSQVYMLDSETNCRLHRKEVCQPKFANVHTNLELLILPLKFWKKEIVVFEPIFTFEKECFTIIFLLISADGRFLKNSLSTPKSQVYMLDSETNCRLHRKEVCQPKFANVHTNLELLILPLKFWKKRYRFWANFHLWKRMFFYHLSILMRFIYPF
jgi:hypothetical protein